jgi:hypothetical protein
MRRSDLTRKLRKLHASMRPVILVAGIEQRSVDQFINNIDNESDDAITEYTDRLEALRLAEYSEVTKIYNLRPPTWWDHMKHIGETNLREHGLLNAATKKFRQAWRQMHHGKKRNSKQDRAKETSSGVGIRSEGEVGANVSDSGSGPGES